MGLYEWCDSFVCSRFRFACITRIVVAARRCALTKKFCLLAKLSFSRCRRHMLTSHTLQTTFIVSTNLYRNTDPRATDHVITIYMITRNLMLGALSCSSHKSSFKNRKLSAYNKKKKNVRAWCNWCIIVEVRCCKKTMKCQSACGCIYGTYHACIRTTETI